MTRYCDICTEYTPEDGQLAIYKKKIMGITRKLTEKKAQFYLTLYLKLLNT